MEEGKKKMLMILVIAACIIAAVIITVVTQSRDRGGLDSIERGSASVWLKCRNEKCEHAWQMDKRGFYEYVQENRIGMQVPAVECPECGEESGYRAYKCEKCGLIFEAGAVPDAVEDTCPKCGYSPIEAKRKEVTGEK